MNRVWHRYANPWSRPGGPPGGVSTASRPPPVSTQHPVGPPSAPSTSRPAPTSVHRPSGSPGRLVMRRPNRELIPGGLASGMPDSAFDPVQLKKGIKVELEHTGNRALAKEIAKDHLMEIPDYYTWLEKMEKEAEHDG